MLAAVAAGEELFSMTLFASLGQNAKSLLAGGTLAAGWYAAAQHLLPHSLSGVAPAAGAIAISGIFPIFFAKTKLSNADTNSQLSVAGSFASLKSTSLINVVNAQDQITEVNDEMCRFTGYTREQLVGQPITKLYSKEGRIKATEIRDHLKHGKMWKGDTPVLCADGRSRMTNTTAMPLFDIDGNWAGSISVRTDTAKLDNIVNERVNSTALHELRDEIWLLDAATLRFRYMNRTALKLMNLTKEAYGLMTLDDLMADYDLSEVKEGCRKLREGEETVIESDITLNGHQYFVSMKKVTIDDDGDRILIVFQDISNRLAKEKMKSDFISTVSHELRSPLTSIKGSMGLLLSDAAGELPPKARGLLEIAHRNAERLVLIINDILDLEKIVSGGMEFELERVDMAALIIEAVRSSAVFSQRFDLNLVTEGCDGPVWVRTDPNRIIQVLTNLLSNATKFSRAKGQITVSLRCEGEHVRISVTDQGRGIPLPDQHKIFERFADMANSDRASKGGTGLGLSICKALVENLQGEIGFDSKEDVGTTFYFTLPVEPVQMAHMDVPELRDAS
jgi:PAS domain S-box-containing protein